MTSTSNTSTATKLTNSGYAHIRETGTSLSAAISKYSRNKDGSPAEITDGLRVLGSPVGSIPFCKTFIESALRFRFLDFFVLSLLLKGRAEDQINDHTSRSLRRSTKSALSSGLYI